MANAITTKSWVWTDSGTQPTQGDEKYVAGDQPVAEYDNWAMWSITSDIDELNATLGDHSSFHEADGQDEINLAGLDVGSVVELAEPAAGVFAMRGTSGGTNYAVLDTGTGRWTTFADFDTRPEFRDGLLMGGGASIRVAEDGGVQTLADMRVTDAPSVGTTQSYGLAVDGTTLLTVSAEADGAGGIQNPVLDLAGVTVDGANGAVTLAADLAAVDGEPIWDETAGHIPQERLENDQIVVSGGNGISGGTAALGGSVSVGIESDSIQTDELDMTIAPTWTGVHTFNAGLGLGDVIQLPTDAGAATLVDVDVSDAPAAGTEQSYALNIDSSQLLKLYSEADGAGGTQNAEVRAQSPVNANGNDLIDGGLVLYDASAGHISQDAVEQGPGSGLDADTLDGSHASDLGSGASDDGVQVLASSTDFNFANALGVTDDGDGTVTIGVESASIGSTELVNDSVTVSAGTNLSGGGAVALGGSTTVSLAGTLSSDVNVDAVMNFNQTNGRVVLPVGVDKWA